MCVYYYYYYYYSDPTITSDPLHSLWERPKIENLIFFFLPWSKCIHCNLKGIFMFKLKLDVTYRPHGHVLSLKWLFLVKNGNFFTFDYTVGM